MKKINWKKQAQIMQAKSESLQRDLATVTDWYWSSKALVRCMDMYRRLQPFDKALFNDLMDLEPQKEEDVKAKNQMLMGIMEGKGEKD